MGIIPGARIRSTQGQDIGTVWVQAQAYFLPSIRDMDSSIRLTFFDDEELEWVDDLPYAEASEGAVGENPTFWTIEFYITAFDALIWNDPENSLTSQFMAGMVIGFGLWINDTDTESVTLYDLSDSFLRHRGNPSSNANYFVDGMAFGGRGVIGTQRRPTEFMGHDKGFVGKLKPEFPE